MEDALLDTYTPLHGISILPEGLAALLEKPGNPTAHAIQQQLLARHAETFREAVLNDRPEYETDEERERLGRLVECRWGLLDDMVVAEEEDPSPASGVGQKRKRTAGGGMEGEEEDPLRLRGLSVALAYERDTFYFVIHSRSSNAELLAARRRRTAATTHPLSAVERVAEPTDQSAILCSKSSPGALRYFIDYICNSFLVPSVEPLELSADLLDVTLDDYLFSLLKSLTRDGNRVAVLRKQLTAILDTIELCIACRRTHNMTTWARVYCEPGDYPSWYHNMAVVARQDHGGWPRDTYLRSKLRASSAQMGVNLLAWAAEEAYPLDPQPDETKGWGGNKHGGDNNSSNGGGTSNTANAPRGAAQPAQPEGAGGGDGWEEDKMMRIAKLSNNAYALFTAGVKFKSHGVRAADAIRAEADAAAAIAATDGRVGEARPAEAQNCVRRANKQLLLTLIDYAGRRRLFYPP